MNTPIHHTNEVIIVSKRNVSATMLKKAEETAEAMKKEGLDYGQFSINQSSSLFLSTDPSRVSVLTSVQLKDGTEFFIGFEK